MVKACKAADRAAAAPAGSSARLCLLLGRRQIPALAIFDGKRGQHAAVIGAGIDRDSVRPFLHRADDSVAVDDDEAMLLGIAEEWIADPAEVMAVLLLQPDPR